MSEITDFRPKTGKLEWHLTYRCNLGCKACSRCSWMKNEHTPDMTLEDAYECMRQADEIGWRQMPGPGNNSEPPRIIIIGGEPTLNPDFAEFVRIAGNWTGTYVQVYSNGYTKESRDLLDLVRDRYSASIFLDGFKTSSREKPADEAGNQDWNLETYVSPADAEMPGPHCYVHCSEICGIGVDHSGYAPCPIGLTVSSVLGIPGKTKRLADLWDIQKVHDMTRAMCADCGYAAKNRFGPTHTLDRFMDYVNRCPKIYGASMSPTWEKAIHLITP
jgi:hypothetical protein